MGISGVTAGRSATALDAAPDGAPHSGSGSGSAPEDGYFRAGAAGAALAGVATAIDVLAAADLSQPGTGGVLDLLRAVECQARRLYGVSVALVGQIEQRGLAAPAGQTSTAALLRQVITIGKGDADARVRLATKVCPSTGISGAPVPPALGKLAAAVQAGQVSARSADTIVHTFKAMPADTDPQLLDAVEEFLVEQSRWLDPTTFDGLARRIQLAANPDGIDQEKDAHEKQEFHIGQRRRNGLTKVWGLLDDLTIEGLRAAFGAMGAPAAQRSRYAQPDTDTDTDTDQNDTGDPTDTDQNDTGNTGDTEQNDPTDVTVGEKPAGETASDHGEDDLEAAGTSENVDGADDGDRDSDSDSDSEESVTTPDRAGSAPERDGEPADPTVDVERTQPNPDAHDQTDQEQDDVMVDSAAVRCGGFLDSHPRHPGHGDHGPGRTESPPPAYPPQPPHRPDAEDPPDPVAVQDFSDPDKMGSGMPGDADNPHLEDDDGHPTRSTGGNIPDKNDDDDGDHPGDHDSPIWRPSRPPYEWAPLGTLPTDYPTTNPDTLTPRLFTDHPDHPDHPDDQNPNRPPDRRSAGTRRAQALSIIIRQFLDSGTAPTQGGQKPHLLVIIDEQSLRDRTGSATLGYGQQLPIDHVRMLACDSRIIPAVMRGHTELLELGRSTRAFNTATSQALLLRDRGCVFPGCDIPGQWTERHHIHHWADGGHSDYTNGALLCRRHHTLIHQGHWHIRLAPDGAPEIIPPTTIDPQQTPQRNTLHHPPQFAWPDHR